MEKKFIPYEEASELKELGFDEPCFAFYDAYNGDSHLFYNLRGKSYWLLRVINALRNKQEQSVLKTSQYHLEYLEGDNAILAPTYSQAFRWFRDKYSLMHLISPYNFTAEILYLNKKIVHPGYADFIPHDHIVDDEGEEIKHSSYEEAELACLRKLIEIVKNQKSNK